MLSFNVTERKQMKTASWFTKLPDDHQRIGISRAAPRGLTPGYRHYRALAPGKWFNTPDPVEYYRLYKSEILGVLDPRRVAADLANLAPGKEPCMLCYEQHGKGQWCHRAMVAEWLAESLGVLVPEYGFELLAQGDHPLMPPQLRRHIAKPAIIDVSGFIGWLASIDGEAHRVDRLDPAQPGRAIIVAGAREYSTDADTLRRHFLAPG